MAYFCLCTSIDTAYWNVANFIELAEQTGYDPASVLPVTVFKTASPSILRTAPYTNHSNIQPFFIWIPADFWPLRRKPIRNAPFLNRVVTYTKLCSNLCKRIVSNKFFQIFSRRFYRTSLCFYITRNTPSATSRYFSPTALTVVSCWSWVCKQLFNKFLVNIIPIFWQTVITSVYPRMAIWAHLCTLSYLRNIFFLWVAISSTNSERFCWRIFMMKFKSFLE